ncbi:MAG: hypothetical protein WCJ46_07160 [bacterium]
MKLSNEKLETIRKDFSLTRLVLAQIQGKRREFIASAGEEDFVPKKELKINENIVVLYSAKKAIDEKALSEKIKLLLAIKPKLGTEESL